MRTILCIQFLKKLGFVVKSGYFLLFIAYNTYRQVYEAGRLLPLLGKAARHFIKHFEKMSVYLKHPELESTNNISEKLAQGSSYFRDSLEGRARFDILRSLHQTCVAAGVPLAHYLLHILLAPALDIQRNPENFTPHAVKNFLATRPNLNAKIERILTKGY